MKRPSIQALRGIFAGEGELHKYYDRLHHSIQSASNYHVFWAQPETDQWNASVEGAAERYREGKERVLEGIPLGVKDSFCDELETTAGSALLRGFRPGYTATVVARLQAAGMITVGKTSMDEFSMGVANTNLPEGREPPVNPHPHPKGVAVAGGSSGGSAAAVALGLCSVALGGDTGGSVRSPAAYCGVIGMKPSYGLLSRNGLVGFAPSLDTVGVMGNHPKDIAKVLDVAAGYDTYDTTSLHYHKPQSGHDCILSAMEGVEGLRVGIPAEYDILELQPEIRAQWMKCRDHLEGLGYTIVPIDLPMTKYALAVYYSIAPAEAASTLARYDGLLYGNRSGKGEKVDEVVMQTRGDLLGDEVRHRILLGTHLLSNDAGHLGVHRAHKVRRLIADELRASYDQVDVLLTPTTPYTAPTIAQMQTFTRLEHYLADILTVPASLAGLPACSFPYGEDDQGMPIGLQLIGNSRQEGMILGMVDHILSTA